MVDQSAGGQSTSVRQIASAASIVGTATLLSRTLGFIRDMVFAWLFGAGMVADAFFAAFRIPSTLRELLGEGALSAAFIPAFTRTASRDGRAAAWTMASKVMGTLLVVLALLTAAGVLLAPWIARAIAFGFGQVPGKLELTATLLRIMFPYILMVGLAALFMAILNSLGHFLTPALSPTVLNVVIIAAALLVAPRASVPVIPIAIAVVLGGVGQLVIQIPAAVRLGWQPAIRVAPRDAAVREIGRLMLPGVAGLAITQINVFVGTLLASLLPQGSVAAIGYAFRLVQYPIGIVGVSIATGALPVMSQAMARGAVDDLKQALRDSLRLGVFLALPALVGLIVFRVPIVGILFERGAFTRSATTLTASILGAYAIGLVFYIANRILAPAFYAMRDTWTPMATGVVAVGVNIASSLLLMGSLGAVGLALATAAASLSNCLQLVWRLRARIGLLGGRVMLRAAGRAALACAPMAAWGIAARLWWDAMAAPSLAGRVGALICQVGVAGAVFVVGARLLRCEELGWAWDLVRRRARPDRG